MQARGKNWGTRLTGAYSCSGSIVPFALNAPRGTALPAQVCGARARGGGRGADREGGWGAPAAAGSAGGVQAGAQQTVMLSAMKMFPRCRIWKELVGCRWGFNRGWGAQTWGGVTAACQRAVCSATQSRSHEHLCCIFTTCHILGALSGSGCVLQLCRFCCASLVQPPPECAASSGQTVPSTSTARAKFR